MTHLSDFSFLQRMVSFAYLYIWYIYRLWTQDRFRCLHPKKFKRGELKSIVTLLILFMIPFQLFYDITSVKIKYEEGFTKILGHIFTKPESMWTKADRDLVVPTEYSLCIGFSLQTGTLVLLQCFWNYLANTVVKANFMSSKEFMFYIFWSSTSFIIFPVLQYNFSRKVYQSTYKEVFPEMVYGIELFIVGCIGVVSHFRFRKLLRDCCDPLIGPSSTQKLIYFQELNLILTMMLFGHGILLTILSYDGLTGRKYLNAHKFYSDFFICNINMCAVVTWFCMILIFHPKPISPATEQDLENIPCLNNDSPTPVFGITPTEISYSNKVHPELITTESENKEIHFESLPIPTKTRQNTTFSSNTAPYMSTAVSNGISGANKAHSKSLAYNEPLTPLHPGMRIDYAPPPLSPAPKAREVPIEQNKRKYSHSMAISLCTDVGEFGAAPNPVYESKQSSTSTIPSFS